jgi:glucokinase
VTHYFISADIGGTKTLLQAAASMNGDTRILCERRYSSRDYGTFSDVLRDFLKQAAGSDASLGGCPPAAACFAVAGPIERGKVQVTNLPWLMDSAAISQEFSIPKVKLINDFAAVASSIETLSDTDLVMLQEGQVYSREMRVALGAGTGMGVAWLIWQGDHYAVSPSEGGHMDLASDDELQDRLLGHLRGRLGHVSVERVLSGPGLTNIFNFLQADGRWDRSGGDSGKACDKGEQPRVTLEEDGAAQVTDLAFNHNHPTALKAMELFVQIYGAYAGNLALAGLTRGGVYIAGGIAPRIIDKLKEGGFMKAFWSKGRFEAVMKKIPVHVVVNPKAGLLGAAQEARRLIAER